MPDDRPRPQLLDRLLAGNAAGAALLAALRLGRLDVPWSQAPLAFSGYAGAWSALSAVVAHRRRRGVTGRVSGLAALVLLGWQLPRLLRRSQPPVPAGAVRIRITTANVLKGRADAAALTRLVRELDPDVLALQEQNPRFLGRLEAAGLRERLPHFHGGPGRRDDDAGVLSRHPLEVTPHPEFPSDVRAVRLLLPGGRRVAVMSAHPLPPVLPWRERSWIASLGRMPAPVGEWAGGLIAGDLNASLDHAPFRRLLARGWRDAATEAGQAWRFTWVGRRIGLLRLTIDHVLVPPGAVVEDVRVDPVPGTDHRALTATVLLPPAA